MDTSSAASVTVIGGGLGSNVYWRVAPALNVIAPIRLIPSAWAWQTLRVKFDHRVVYVPLWMLILDPHQRDIDRQFGTLIDSTGACSYSSSGLA